MRLVEIVNRKDRPSFVQRSFIFLAWEQPSMVVLVLYSFANDYQKIVTKIKGIQMFLEPIYV